MISCYILHSFCLDKFYVGITHESVENRLLMHNNATYGNHFTSRVNDWEIFLIILCSTVSQSMKIEKHIKKMKSKVYIQNLKVYPEIIDKIKLLYQG